MATYYTPKIVTSGLVFALDANNTKSYPLTGTTVYDISYNGNNFALVNGPSVDSSGLNLDGVNDYAYVNHGGSLAFSSGPFTVSVWHRNNTSATTYNGIITNDNTGDDSWKIFRDNGNAFYVARSGVYTANFPAYTVNRFHHYAYTFDGSSTMTLYFDGSYVTSATGGQPTSNRSYLALGSYRYNDAVNGYYLVNQTIGPIALYNRVLSNSEILQNYNATKKRFGL